VLVVPLVSALHVHAVADVRRDREPRLGPVALRGLKVLPIVAAAPIVSWLGIVAGFALIVPGIFLLLRWAVVAQAAAIEHEGWLPALRRSGRLSEDRYGHIAVFLIMVGVIATVPPLAAVAAFGHHDTSAPAFLSGVGLHAITASFSALASALLYYDLVARWKAASEQPAAAAARPRPACVCGWGSAEGLVRRSRIPHPHASLGRPQTTRLEREHADATKDQEAMGKQEPELKPWGGGQGVHRAGNENGDGRDWRAARQGAQAPVPLPPVEGTARAR
jgi:hypothetical protein